MSNHWDTYQGVMNFLGGSYLLVLFGSADPVILNILGLAFFTWVIGVGLLLFTMESDRK